MNSEYLKTFIAVCDMGSFSRAEEKLFISKQAIMQQMNLLEKDVGVKLLKRSSRGASPTQAGAVFLRWAGSLLNQEQKMLEEVRKAGEGGGRVRLISIDYHVILNPVTEAYRRRYPNVNIEMVFHPATLEARLVAQGVIDVGDTLFSPEYNTGALRYEKLLDMPYFCISLHDMKKDRVEPEDLLNESLLADGREFGDYYGFQLDALKRLFPSLKVVNSAERRIAVIDRAVREGKTVITASTFARQISGLFTTDINVGFRQECGIVFRADAPKEVVDYVELAREIYSI